MTKPITPDEVTKQKSEALPDQVIEAFNELIAQQWDGRKASFKQHDVVNLIVSKMEVRRGEVFDKHWLDIEEVYKEAGWVVDYDQPGWADAQYEPIFTFTKPEKK